MLLLLALAVFEQTSVFTGGLLRTSVPNNPGLPTSPHDMTIMAEHCDPHFCESGSQCAKDVSLGFISAQLVRRIAFQVFAVCLK